MASRLSAAAATPAIRLAVETIPSNAGATSGGGDVVGIGSSDEGLGLRLLLGERAVDGGLEATSEIHQERWPFWRNGGNLAP